MLKRIALVLIFTIVLVSCSNQINNDNPINSIPTIISIEEAKEKVSFDINQPTVPFNVTKSSAKILDTNGNFDAVEITYENTDESLNLVLMINNSKVESKENGKKGAVLDNGSQTWEQGDENVSAIHWRIGDLKYLLISGKKVDDRFVPLYNYPELVEIANSIN